MKINVETLLGINVEDGGWRLSSSFNTISVIIDGLFDHVIHFDDIDYVEIKKDEIRIYNKVKTCNAFSVTEKIYDAVMAKVAENRDYLIDKIIE